MKPSWFERTFRRHRWKRTVQFLSYAEADQLIKTDPSWQIAEEEDHNRAMGWVYLEQWSRV